MVVEAFPTSDEELQAGALGVLTASTLGQLVPITLLAQAALETLSTGVVLVDKEGSIEYQNVASSLLFRSHDGVQVQNGCLRLSNREQNLRLQRAIAEVARLGQGTVIPMKRSGGKLPLMLTLARVPFLAGRAAVAIFISDLSRQTAERAHVLANVLGFSAGELRVAVRVCEGMSLAQVADQLHLSINTVKTQLRSVFNKTGCSRQTELVKLLTAMPL